jgi:hypothetical protein
MSRYARRSSRTAVPLHLCSCAVIGAGSESPALSRAGAQVQRGGSGEPAAPGPAHSRVHRALHALRPGLRGAGRMPPVVHGSIKQQSVPYRPSTAIWSVHRTTSYTTLHLASTALNRAPFGGGLGSTGGATANWMFFHCEHPLVMSVRCFPADCRRLWCWRPSQRGRPPQRSSKRTPYRQPCRRTWQICCQSLSCSQSRFQWQRQWLSSRAKLPRPGTCCQKVASESFQ